MAGVAQTGIVRAQFVDVSLVLQCSVSLGFSEDVTPEAQRILKNRRQHLLLSRKGSGGQIARVGTRGASTARGINSSAGVAVKNCVVLAIFRCYVALRRRTNDIAVRRNTTPAMFASLILVELPLVLFCCHRSPPFLKVHTLGPQWAIICAKSQAASRANRARSCTYSRYHSSFARKTAHPNRHKWRSGIAAVRAFWWAADGAATSP